MSAAALQQKLHNLKVPLRNHASKKRYHEFLGTVSAECLWETLGRNVYFWFYLQYELES